MSSGPVGLDVREYVYGYFVFTSPDAGTHTISAHNDWLVTRIQYYAAAGAAAVLAAGAGSPINVVAGGCVELEPNGALKESIQINGLGSMLIVEYWFQAIEGAFVATLPITVT